MSTRAVKPKFPTAHFWPQQLIPIQSALELIERLEGNTLGPQEKSRLKGKIRSHNFTSFIANATYLSGFTSFTSLLPLTIALQITNGFSGEYEFLSEPMVIVTVVIFMASLLGIGYLIFRFQPYTHRFTRLVLRLRFLTYPLGVSDYRENRIRILQASSSAARAFIQAIMRRRFHIGVRPDLTKNAVDMAGGIMLAVPEPGGVDLLRGRGHLFAEYERFLTCVATLLVVERLDLLPQLRKPHESMLIDEIDEELREYLNPTARRTILVAFTEFVLPILPPMIATAALIVSIMKPS